MKQVIRYEAEDGNVFETEKACLEHEFKVNVRHSLFKLLEWDDNIFAQDAGHVVNFIVKNYPAIKAMFERKEA